MVAWYNFIKFKAAFFTVFYLSYSGLALSSIRARLNKVRTAFCNSAYVAIDDQERAINTISHPGLIALMRTISRNRRLTLFLTTAFPTLLLIDKPLHDMGRPLGI